LRTALFWVVTQRVVVILINVSGQYIDPIFRGQEASERNKHYSLGNNQKNAVLSYFAAEA
jgi:hypothetical protein